MNHMSTEYHESGRRRQKQRTRAALLDAARTLISGGEAPTVDEVARTSGISRTTAYRYFPTQTHLLAAAFPETVTTSMLPTPAPQDVASRVRVVAAGVIAATGRNEVQQRAMLRLSLGEVAHDLPLRKGRAIGWYTEALAPLQEAMSTAQVRSLAKALRAVSGIETRVWLADVASLNRHELEALQEWMTRALVTYAGQEPPPTDGPTPAEVADKADRSFDPERASQS